MTASTEQTTAMMSTWAIENKIKLHQREVDDIWKGMDALANPLG